MRKQSLRQALIVSLVLAVSALSIWFMERNLENSKPFDGTVLESPEGLAPFSLIGIDGKEFNNDSLKGGWTLLFFGFTRCRYLSPTTFEKLKKMYEILGKSSIRPLPRIVFISIDPEQDTLTVLKQYVQSFHPDFYAARGDLAVVEKMALELGIPFKKMIADTVGNDIAHSGALMLFNPIGKLVAFFREPHDPKRLVNDYKTVTFSTKVSVR